MEAEFTFGEDTYLVEISRSVQAIQAYNAIKGLAPASPHIDSVEALVISIDGRPAHEFDDDVQMLAMMAAADFLAHTFVKFERKGPTGE